MIRYPLNKKYSQTNRSDVLGNIAWSWNIDPQSRLGKLRASPRTLLLANTAVDSDLTDIPVGFKAYATKIYTVAGGKVHVAGSADTLNVTFGAVGTSGAPTNQCSSSVSDLEIFNDCLYVTTTGHTYKLSGSTWSDFAIGAGSSSPKMLTTYADKLYQSDLPNKIYSITTADTPTLALTLGNTIAVTVMRSAANRIWIGTLNRSTGSQSYGKGYVYSWDGAAAQPSASYRLEAQGCLAMVIKDDIPWIMDTNGRLMYWSGGNFLEAARLPLDDKYLAGSLNQSNDRWIHPNGMTIVNGKINILINNQLFDGNTPHNILEQCPSGVWEFDPNIGLYHKFSVGYTPRASTTVTDYGQNRLSKVGAIADMKLMGADATPNGQLILGANYYTDATTTTSGIFMDDTNDTAQKAAYFVTSKFESPNVTDEWVKIWMKYRKFLNSADEIVVKYRSTEVDPTEMTITWTSTTTFTTTDANMANYAVGDEVEITQGKGSGLCSHITAISLNTGTYTITVDETYTGATSGTAKARLQKWIKAGSITGQTKNYWEIPLSMGSSTWIQLKICLLFTGKDEFEEFLLVNKANQPAK